MTKNVILQPIAMIVPTSEAVYTPSRIEKLKIIHQKEFLQKYADYPHPVSVSFEADGRSNPQIVSAYGYGLDCWYIVASGSEGER